MSSNILRLSRSLFKYQRQLSHMLVHRNASRVQEFPGLKFNNAVHQDHVLILPEPIDANPETNEVLRIAKSGQTDIDFKKLDLEQVFFGVHHAIGDFENFTTDLNNSSVKLDIPLKEFFKLLERNLFPMDTAFYVSIMMFMAKPNEYNHKEVFDLFSKYYRVRRTRFDGIFRSYIFGHLMKNTDQSNLSDPDRRMLLLYNNLGPNSHRLNNEQIGSIKILLDHLEATQKVFLDNLRNADMQFGYTVDDPDILAAISPEFDDCQDLHHKERTPLKITTDTYAKFMRVCPDRFIRQMLWEGYNKRCSPKGSPADNNTTLLGRIQIQRRKAADMMGYRSFLEQRMEIGMATSRREVLDNLTMLNSFNRPKTIELIEELYNFARDDGFEDPNGLGIREFDVDYWTHRYTYDVLFGKSERELKSFFPMESVMSGMKSYFKNYFDIDLSFKSVERLSSEHTKSIGVFKDGKLQGTILFDPVKTEGQKPGLSYSRVRGRYPRYNEINSLPVRYATASYIVDPATNQIHLSATEVIEIFKLFMTVIQRVLYNYEYYELNLIGGLENEAVNLLPNLCNAHLLTDHRIIQSCSNRGSSKPIDSGMSRKILKAVQHFKPLTRWQSLYQAHVDVEYNGTMRDMKLITEEAYEIYSPFPKSNDHYDYCTMTRVMFPPDNATLYADLWSRQMANQCLQASVSSNSPVDDISQVDLTKLKEFNVKLVEFLLDQKNFDTNEKLLALTGSVFQPSKSSLGVL